MKTYLIGILIFKLVTSFLTKQNNPITICRSEQLTYSYKSESIGYYDISYLYSSDSTELKRPFFYRNRLEDTQINISCEIRKTIYSKEKEWSQVYFEILSPNISIRNSMQPINVEEIKRELQYPILATIKNQGTFSNIRIDTSISYLTSNIIRDILSRFQFTVPENTSSAWRATEENTSGIFISKYKLISNINNKREYEKTNEGFTEWDGAQNGQKINIDSKTLLAMDSSGQICQIDVSEAQAILFSFDTIAVSGSEVSVALISKGYSTEDEIGSIENICQLPKYNRSTNLRNVLSDDQIKELTYKSTLGNNDIASLMLDLKIAISNKEVNMQQQILKFRALAFLFPRSCKELEAVLSKAPFGSVEFKVISLALTASATPEATNAIARVILDRIEEEDILLKLLPVCATTTAPTDEAFNIINEIAFKHSRSREVQYAAQLALGGMVYNFRNSDSLKAEILTQYLIDKTGNIKDTIQQIFVLGNTGSPSVIAILKLYIDSVRSSKEVKASSITALRLIENEEVIQILKEVKHNNDSFILQAVKETISFRSNYY
mgnify:FL=1